MQSVLMDVFTSPYLGWVAVGLFALSYLVKREFDLLRLQGVSACLWIAYGWALGAMPIVTANVVVAAGAAYKATRIWRARNL